MQKLHLQRRCSNIFSPRALTVLPRSVASDRIKHFRNSNMRSQHDLGGPHDGASTIEEGDELMVPASAQLDHVKRRSAQSDHAQTRQRVK